MPFTSLWPQPDKNWNFDVSSLIVLIGEDMELQYRLSRRSFLQCVSAAPVVGLQNYLRSYDFLFEPGSLFYQTPYGCAGAPLPSARLANAIKAKKLLEDSNFTVYSIPQNAPPLSKYDIILQVWCVGTWLVFGGIIAFVTLAPKTTWIGVANITLLTSWSIIVRLVEYLNMVPSKAKDVDRPDGPDAIFILGRDNSAFVLKGSRMDIKKWVTRGLIYEARSPNVEWILQGFTRFTSLAVLLFIFSTLPNGHTMDQLAFIVLNAMAQINALLGQWLNSLSYISQLDLDTSKSCKVRTRTEVWGKLIKEFKAVNEQNDWINALDLLPKTDKWQTWKAELLKNVDQDPKALYNSLPGR
jgi:hypothetical protein